MNKKSLKKKLAVLIKKWNKQNANQPTKDEKRKYVKQLKKHRKDQVKFSAPKPVRGWWVG